MKQKDNNRLEPITFDQMIYWLYKVNKGVLYLPTLKGESHFHVHYIFDNKICIVGSTNTGICIGMREWEEVSNYMNNLPAEDTWNAKSYSRPNIIGPTMEDKSNFGPSIPAICKAYWAYHKK